MRILGVILLLAICLAEPLIKKDFLKKLRKTVPWEVTDYENNVFKGLSVEDFQDKADLPSIVLDLEDLPSQKKSEMDPNAINWIKKSASCIHEIKNLGECEGGSYALAVAGMVSDRCCLKGKDHGSLSAMELLSCSGDNYGCAGGWPAWAVQYAANGLVDELCYPYSGRNEECPKKCKNGKDWNAMHVCKCSGAVALRSLADVRTALDQGPVVVTFEAYDDLFAYKSGIYCHTVGGFKRLISARVIGYSEDPQPHLVLAMPFGPLFGEKGFVRMCTTCCGMFGKYEKGNVACTPAP